MICAIARQAEAERERRAKIKKNLSPELQRPHDLHDVCGGAGAEG